MQDQNQRKPHRHRGQTGSTGGRWQRHDGLAAQPGLEGPQARNVTDLAMLLSVQAGFDARIPLSNSQDPKMFTRPLKEDHRGVRIGWMGDYNGYLTMEPGVMDLSQKALKHFETIGCSVDAVQPDFSMERLWTTWLTMRGVFARRLGGRLVCQRQAARADEARGRVGSGAGPQAQRR